VKVNILNQGRSDNRLMDIYQLKDETLGGFLNLNKSTETQRKQTTSYKGCSQERRLEAGSNE